jgi:hypothetical protein
LAGKRNDHLDSSLTNYLPSLGGPNNNFSVSKNTPTNHTPLTYLYGVFFLWRENITPPLQISLNKNPFTFINNVTYLTFIPTPLK